MSITLVFALSLFTSIALVPLAIRYASVLGLVDTPDGQRKVHTKVIPRSGGLAIAAASIIPIAYIALTQSVEWRIVIPALIIVFFGVLDDRFELSYKWKFGGQILAVLLYTLSFGPIEKLPFFIDQENAFFIPHIILFVFILGVTNAVNLSDGLDGLAGGATLLSLALIAYFAYASEQIFISIFAVAVIGALLGFLRYNTHPAKVFMGDTGSQFIGFMLAVLSIELTQNTSTAYSPLLPIFIVGLPIIDTAMVMSIRLAQGRSPFSPDKNHIHHQLLSFGFHHYETVALIYILQMLFITTAFVICYFADWVVLLGYLVFSGLIIWCLSNLKYRSWTIRKPQDSNKPERRNFIFRRLSFFHDYGSQLLSATLGCYWATLIYLGETTDNTMPWIAVSALCLTFLLAIVRPNLSPVYTRIAAYSTSTLALYPMLDSSLYSDHTRSLLNVFAIILGCLLALTIRVTRRNNFQLDNQDILVLFILIGATLIPNDSISQFDTSIAALKLALMLYIVEYLINNLKTKLSIVFNLSTLFLFIIAIR